MANDKGPESPWARARVPSKRSNPPSGQGEGLKRTRLHKDEPPRKHSQPAAQTPWRRSSPLAEGEPGSRPALPHTGERPQQDARSGLASAGSAANREDGKAPPAPAREARLYGLNACLAAFGKRPEALRKVYLTETRIPALRNVLAWCVKHRLGYRVVEEADLDKLTSSRHHEGVCFDLQRPPPLELAHLLAALPPSPAPSLLLWLDGVGNPHNLGALLRSAAHFGAHGVIVPAAAGLDVSGAAARVAEGAAEIVPLVQANSATDALATLRAHGYTLAATVPRDGVSLYATPLPSRLVLVFGAEGEGMSQPMIEDADLRLSIPGSGAIDSLNVSASVAVLLGEYWRQQGKL